MLLEIQVVGSAEWYEKVMPMLDTLKFKQRTELRWSDPNTDGELMGYYYTYDGKEPMPFNELIDTINDIEQIINDGEAPYIKINIVSDKK